MNWDDDGDRILAKRHHKGGDFWATPDGRVYVGNPFSTLVSLLMLHELGVERGHEAVEGGLALVFAAWRDDGRIRLGPRTPMYPCYSGAATRVLCRYRYYVYVLSFYDRARRDERFREAWKLLCGRLDDDGRVVIEKTHGSLGGLQFCKQGNASEAATRRLGEIRENLGVGA